MNYTMQVNVAMNAQIAIFIILKFFRSQKLIGCTSIIRHAFVHLLANFCPVQGTSEELYDRTKLFPVPELQC